MSTPVKLCMIGAGGHASRHLYPCFSQLKNAQVVANADLDIEKARARAAKYSVANSYDDYHEMLEREQPDGVLICVGPDFHGRTAIELMRLGFHVYMEKPPAIDLAQAREVFATQRETGKFCMTAFKKRYAPAYMKAKEIIESERFGQPAVLSILRTSGPFKQRQDPRHTYQLESNVHVIDLATYLFGRVQKVSGFKNPPQNYSFSMQFENGAAGTLTLTDRMSYARGWEDVTIVGSNGVLIEVDNSVEMIAFEKDTPFAAHKPEFVAGNSHSSVEMGFTGEIQAFVDAIASGTPPQHGYEASLHSVEIVTALEKAVNEGGIIKLCEL